MRERDGLRPTNTFANRSDARSTLTESDIYRNNHKGKNVLLPTKLASIFLLTSLSFLGARGVHSGSYSETPNKPAGTSLESFDPELGQIAGDETANLPPGFSETEYATGLNLPTEMEFAPDGRLFVAERGGKVKVIKDDGVILSEPFLQLDTNGELRGITLDPDFEKNGYIYVQYTFYPYDIHVSIQARVSRFKVSDTNHNIADPDSETILIETGQGYYWWTTNVGGPLSFGNDGKLYIATGDYTSGDYRIEDYLQQTDNLFGKILRINPDGTIPDDNPHSFVIADIYSDRLIYKYPEGVNRAIYALGFHHPSTIAVDPETGKIFINEIGHVRLGGWNEINVLEKGGNYGWPIVEDSSDDYRFTNPIYEYRNIGSDGLPTFTAITGGAFYRSGTFPAKYDGAYFFADENGGWIKYLDPKTLQVSDFLSSASLPVDLRVGPDGALYYLSFDFGDSGSVHKIQFEDQTPTATVTKEPSTYTPTVIENQAATPQTPAKTPEMPEYLPGTGTDGRIRDKGARGLNNEFTIAGLLSAGAGALGISAITNRRRSKG